jgi:ssDNA-binding Zn-finger/Zn-ribbon topoisomerase 1
MGWKTMLGDFWKTFKVELDASEGAERIRMTTGKICPKCQGELLVKAGKAGASFLGCENYPDCDYVSETDGVAAKL